MLNFKPQPYESEQSPNEVATRHKADQTRSPENAARDLSARRAIRVAYVGPNMDVFEAAYQPVHQALGHSIEYVRTVGELPSLSPKPDVVVINPLVVTPFGVDGACAVHEVVSEETVIFVIYTNIGASHTMYTRHALAGRCHPRMLLHYPSIHLDRNDIIDEMDRLVRGAGGGPQIRTTHQLPPSLIHGLNRKDLGRVLLENVEQSRSARDSLTFASLLYVAALNSHWATWGDLAGLLGFGIGHVKNTKARIGRILTEEVLPDEAAVGAPKLPTGTGQRWSIAEFTRFVTEHRSFIRAYCEHHLLIEQSPVGIHRVAASH